MITREDWEEITGVTRQPDAELAYTILDGIESGRVPWDQNIWQRCFAGLTAAHCGYLTLPNGSVYEKDEQGQLSRYVNHIAEVSAELLGIEPVSLAGVPVDQRHTQADRLFSVRVQSMLELRAVVEDVFGPDARDRSLRGAFR